MTVVKAPSGKSRFCVTGWYLQAIRRPTTDESHKSGVEELNEESRRANNHRMAEVLTEQELQMCIAMQGQNCGVRQERDL